MQVADVLCQRPPGRGAGHTRIELLEVEDEGHGPALARRLPGTVDAYTCPSTMNHKSLSAIDFNARVLNLI